jgi:hypothetical protein
MKFRKKPVVIEAMQWFKVTEYPGVVRHFRRPEPEFGGSIGCPECGAPFHEHGFIDTLEGGHRVCPGDWIITGVVGERYPCKPHIFMATYDIVEPEA